MSTSDTSDDVPVEDAAPRESDALLLALSHLCQHFGRPRSPEALRASLPVAGATISPKLFRRAAHSAGMRAEIVQRPVEGLKKLRLPAVLVLADGGAAVLHRLGGNQAELFLPESGQTRRVDLGALKRVYSGFAIPVQPDPRAQGTGGMDDGFDAEMAAMRRGHWFWSTLWENRWSYGQVAIAAVLINLFALAGPIFVMTVYDRVVPNDALETLTALAVGVVVAFVFDFVIRTVRAYLIDVAGHEADQQLATRIFDQLLSLQLAARPQATGSFASVLKEFESLRDFFTSASLTTIVDLPFVFLFVLFVFVIGGPLGWVLLVAIAVTFLICLAVHWPLGRVARQAQGDGAQKHAVLVETVSGLETLKSLGAEGRARFKWEHAVALTAESATKSRTLSMLALNLTQFIQQLSTVSIVVIGVFLVRDATISSGSLIAAVILGGRALGPIAQFAALLVRLHASMATLKALDKVMALPTERPASKSFLHRPTLKGEIAFKDVTFAYPRQEVLTLASMSFSIAAGDHVGIIGRVGSGKSTIHKLVLGLFQPNGGAVLADGTDLRQIDPADLRRNIGYLPQDVVLFRGTVRENIAIAAPNASDADVLRASILAGVDDFVRKHPQGYDLVIGERGEGLSGGQRQSIGLARALVHDPQILLLDEPTSSLDSTAEDGFRRRLAEAIDGKTLVLVTHRNALLPLVDRLIVIDSGKVVADGARDAVLQALAGGKVLRSEPAAKPAEGTPGQTNVHLLRRG